MTNSPPTDRYSRPSSAASQRTIRPSSPSFSSSDSKSTRLRPGMRLSEWQPVVDPFSTLLPYSHFDASSFQTAEYINYLVRTDPHDVERITSLPMRGADEEEGEEGEPEVEADCWVYEQLRRLAIDQSYWIVALANECDAETCPEMKAGEWLYLCAAHSTPPTEPCSAISYCSHKLSGSISLLSSPRYFPSRLSIPPSSLKFLPAISRRLYRSFAHAYFHHRAVFNACEEETSLCKRFIALAAAFDLIEDENLIIPLEAFTGGDAVEVELL